MAKRKADTQPLINAPINKEIKSNESDYKQFLNKHVRNKLNPIPKNFDTWPDVSKDDRGKIINDIARKTNNNPNFNIDLIKLINKGDPTYGTKLDKSQWSTTLNMPNNVKPAIMGHELIHANDHQTDNLNAKVWNELLKLREAYGFKKFNDYKNKTKETPDDFSDIVEQVQDKIDPSKAFAGAPGENARYNIDGPYIAKEIDKAVGEFNPDHTKPKGIESIPYFTPSTKKINNSYQLPITNNQNKDVDWPELEKHIRGVLNHQSSISSGATQQTLPNAPFFLNRASEFPAYMSENLTNRWRTNEITGTTGEPIKALGTPQRQFISNVLGHMGNTYPSPEYSTINKYVRERKNSVDKTLPPPNMNNQFGTPPSGIGNNSSSNQNIGGFNNSMRFPHTSSLPLPLPLPPPPPPLPSMSSAQFSRIPQYAPQYNQPVNPLDQSLNRQLPPPPPAPNQIQNVQPPQQNIGYRNIGLKPNPISIISSVGNQNQLPQNRATGGRVTVLPKRNYKSGGWVNPLIQMMTEKPSDNPLINYMMGYDEF